MSISHPVRCPDCGSSQHFTYTDEHIQRGVARLQLDQDGDLQLRPLGTARQQRYQSVRCHCGLQMDLEELQQLLLAA